MNQSAPTKPRVLYIGAGDPWAGGAGFLVRQRFLLEALGELANLHVALFDTNPADPPASPFPFTHVPSPKRTIASRYRLLAEDVFSPLPRTLRGYDRTAPRRAIQALQPDTFDAVFAFRIDFAFFAGVLGRPNLLLDIDDPEHLRVKRRLTVHFKNGGDWRTRLDLHKLRRFEHRAAAGAVWASVCQANDSHGWPVPLHVVPNCVEVPVSPTRVTGPPRLLFVGNCNAGEQNPNVDAVKFLLKEIWPSVLAAVPAARLQIVGATSERVRAWAADAPSVDVLGFVNDLSAVYAAAGAAVAPIRFGTGTRIKILEAFAHACPVVSTTIGIEGIDAAPGEQFALGDSPEVFATQCVALLTDAAERDRLSLAGYKLARKQYDRRTQRQRLIGELQTTLATLPQG